MLSIALLLLITLLRLAVSNPIEAVGFLYVIPISLVAADRGWRSGLAIAAGAFALTVLWAVTQDVPLGAVGYAARAATFASVGILVGLQTAKRRSLQAERERLIAELHASAMRDQLTGLPNRRAWDDRLEVELRHASGSGRALSLAAIDLDRLKPLNDTYGHEHGDRVIQRCARAWAAALSDRDFIARLGGDEFLVLLPGCSEEDAREVAQRMLGPLQFNHPFSMGLATWNGREAGYELVRRADRAMYAAKAAGGGRITHAPPANVGTVSLTR